MIFVWVIDAHHSPLLAFFGLHQLLRNRSLFLIWVLY